MPPDRVPERSEIAQQYTWNAESLFGSRAAWEAELDRLDAVIPAMSPFQGRLAEGPAILAQALDVMQVMMTRLGKIYVYASMSQAVDVRDQSAAVAQGRAQALFGKYMAAQSFLEPELLVIGEVTLRAWIGEEPRLANLAHYIDDLFRQQAHVRSAEVEQLLGMLMDPFGSVMSTFNALTDADFVFPPAVGADGSEIDLTQGTLQKILAGPDREARRTAYEHYTDTYLEFKNTLASNLSASLKQNIFQMRAKRYASSLEMSLFRQNIPTDVFHNLIAAFRKHLPTWHRYWRVRRKALGVDVLHPYDIWAPLRTNTTTIPFEQAIDWISEGLAPMGDAYVETLRKGALTQRWVDVYPNQGKTAGAFSSGFRGTYPFILISYNDNIFSLSTLAHELGHSMHSHLTWEHQPFLYSDYSLFVAEVASNFHQAMVRDYLLRTKEEVDFQISVIEEAMSNFHRYFFIMPTLARFELEAHQRVERGQGLNADGLMELMADLFSEGYGDEMTFDRRREGITWATFIHLYIDYYVYQYATGISGANALAKRILSGDDPGAVNDYLGFLKTGGSAYPLDALKLAGVDLTTPEAVEVTFGVLGDMVDRLEVLITQREGGQ
jgi:oligoendopeptidase F